jgi:hypothetical protein
MTPPRPRIEAVSNAGRGSYPLGQRGVHEAAGIYAAGMYAADWGVAEAPHKPVKRAARGWRQGGAPDRPLYAARGMERAPPFMNKPALPSGFE